MEPHTHGPNGEWIPLDGPPAEPAEVAETAADAEVEVAKIHAKRDVELAKIDVQREEMWQEGRVAELEGRVRGMQEILDRLQPSEPPAPEPGPEPEPIVIEEPPAPAEPVEPPPAPVEENPPPRKKKSGIAWF